MVVSARKSLKIVRRYGRLDCIWYITFSSVPLVRLYKLCPWGKKVTY